MKIKSAALLAPILVGAAAHADVLPQDIVLEMQHVSHISQHFGADRTNFGYDDPQLTVRWGGTRWSFEISDGIILQPCVNDSFGDHTRCGSLFGPREVFSARLGLKLWTKR